MILLAPFCLAVLARLGNRTPISVRLALRDLSRYRARSGSALAAISIGILIAVIISVAAAARFANVLDYAGPNLASNQLIVYTPNGQGGGPGGPGPHGARPAYSRCRPRRTPSPPPSAPGMSSNSRPRTPTSTTTGAAATGPGRCMWPPRSCCMPSGSRVRAVQSHGRHPQHAARAVRPLQHAAQLRQPPRAPAPSGGPGPEPDLVPLPEGQLAWPTRRSRRSARCRPARRRPTR